MLATRRRLLFGKKTARFALTDSRVVYAPGADGDAGTVAGFHAYQWSVGLNGGVFFSFTGSSCAIHVRSNSSGTMQISVDGGTFRSISLVANTWMLLTIASGLPDCLHTIAAQVDNSTLLWIDIGSADALQISGSNPSLSLTAGMSTNVTRAATSSHVTGDNTTSDPGISGGAAFGIKPDCNIRFKTNATTVQFWCLFSTGSTFSYAIDGVDSGVFVPVNRTSGFTWYPITAGLDGSTHEITVYSVNATSNDRTSAPVFLSYIMCAGGTLDTSYTPTARNVWIFYGDSIVMANVIGVPVATYNSDGFAHLLAQHYGRGCVNLGYDGSPVKTDASIGGVDRVALVTGNSPAPKVVFISYGANDCGQVAGAETSGQFQTAYQTMLSSIVGGLDASTPIYCLGVFPNNVSGGSSPYTTNRSSFNTAMSAAVTAVGASNATYVSTDGWLSTTISDGDLGPDGLHVTAQGYLKIVAQLETLLGASPP